MIIDNKKIRKDDDMDSIDYSKIDKECIELVRFFNEYGLKTQFSCKGHNENKLNSYFIIFDKIARE